MDSTLTHSTNKSKKKNIFRTLRDSERRLLVSYGQNESQGRMKSKAQLSFTQPTHT